MNSFARWLRPWLGLGLTAILSAQSGPLGIEMVPIPAGTFRMGSNAGNWDEVPVHAVTISKPFLISKREITRSQFLQFRPNHKSGSTGKAICVTWDDAMAFCAWLSEREGKSYRLPTEAEWEYACRREGTDGEGQLIGMLDHVAEWCLDWYGPYGPEAVTDPVGPVTGLVRVLRGDKQDLSNRAIAPWSYNRPAYRAGMPPAYGLPFVESEVSFRIVEAPPAAKPTAPAEQQFFRLGVKQSTGTDALQHPPSADKPYFRKRYLLPSPPETAEGNNYENPGPQRLLTALALHPGIGAHNHNAALEVLPNGDLLFVAYTCWTEYNPEVGLIVSRLRAGAEQWDMPDFGFDLVGANDHGPLLWTDGAQTHLFWGNPKLGAMHPYAPFQFITTTDSGATWSEVRYPVFTTKIPPNDSTPVSTVVRDRDGILYLAADGAGADSIAWVSDDNMKTWKDMGGRTNGGHTSFALLSDGKTLFGLNARKTHLDYHMTSSISRDGARTFVTGRTPFPWGGSNQRASLLRLRDGTLLAAGDCQHPTDVTPPEFKAKRGCFFAYSRDDGVTWKFKDIPGTQPHEEEARKHMDTIGYSVLRQGPDGVIHLVTTMNKPALHFSFNAAWLYSDAPDAKPDPVLRANTATRISDVRVHEEKYPDGRPRLTWSAGIGDDGRYLLHGPEQWRYPDGTLQYEVKFELGRKIGREVLYDPRGGKVWEWKHDPDGRSEWTQYWPNGKTKAQSRWQDFHADGPAQTWDRDGHLLTEVNFQQGMSAP